VPIPVFVNLKPSSQVASLMAGVFNVHDADMAMIENVHQHLHPVDIIE
jgi:hypothetical protein